MANKHFLAFKNTKMLKYPNLSLLAALWAKAFLPCLPILYFIWKIQKVKYALFKSVKIYKSAAIPLALQGIFTIIRALKWGTFLIFSSRNIKNSNCPNKVHFYQVNLEVEYINLW